MLVPSGTQKAIAAVFIAVISLGSFSLTSATSIVEVAIVNPDDLETLQRGGFDIVYLSPGRMVDVVIKDQEELDKSILISTAHLLQLKLPY